MVSQDKRRDDQDRRRDDQDRRRDDQDRRRDNPSELTPEELEKKQGGKGVNFAKNARTGKLSGKASSKARR